jgi:hypothetical protein
LIASARTQKRGGAILAVVASELGSVRRPPRTEIRTVIVAQSQLTIAAGSSSTVTLNLSRIGKQLLSRFYKLPAAVLLKGDGQTTTPATITFAYPVVTPPPSPTWDTWTWLNKPCTVCYTTIDTSYFFGVPELLPIAKVTVRCAGSGCPPPRSFGPGKRTESNRM